MNYYNYCSIIDQKISSVNRISFNLKNRIIHITNSYNRCQAFLKMSWKNLNISPEWFGAFRFYGDSAQGSLKDWQQEPATHVWAGLWAGFAGIRHMAVSLQSLPARTCQPGMAALTVNRWTTHCLIRRLSTVYAAVGSSRWWDCCCTNFRNTARLHGWFMDGIYGFFGFCCGCSMSSSLEVSCRSCTCSRA